MGEIIAYCWTIIFLSPKTSTFGQMTRLSQDSRKQEATTPYMKYLFIEDYPAPLR